MTNVALSSTPRVTLLAVVAIVASCLDSEPIAPEPADSSASAGSSSAGASASAGAGQAGEAAGMGQAGDTLQGGQGGEAGVGGGVAGTGEGGSGAGGSNAGQGGTNNGGSEQGAGVGGTTGTAGVSLQVAFAPLVSYGHNDGDVLNNVGGLTVGDFTGDGKLDVISSYSKVFGSGVFLTKKEGAFLFHGNGDGTFLSSPHPLHPDMKFAQGEWVVLGGHPFDVSSLDLDGDGFLDLLVADNGDDKVHLHRNDGKGVFSKMGEVQAPPGLVNLFLGDLDGDGKPEVLTLSTGRGFKANDAVGLKDKILTVFCNNGASLELCWQKVLMPESSESPGYEPRIALGDQDADGKDEILVGLLGGEVLLFRDVLSEGGGAVVNLKAPCKEATYPTSASFGDLGPGGRDIVVCADLNVQLLRAGASEFIASTGFTYAQHQRILDMNGDGVGDLVTAMNQYEGSHTFSIFAGSKEGMFSHLLSIPGPAMTFTEHWRAVDLNGDKKLDLLAKHIVLVVALNESK